MRTTLSLFAATFVAATFAATAEVVVPVPHFDSIELRGAGHVTLRHGDGERVTIVQGNPGYTHFHVDSRIRFGHQTLVIDTCVQDCPSGYAPEIEVETPHAGAISVEGSGTIDRAPGFPQPSPG
jgi:hypothetical protein